MMTRTNCILQFAVQLCLIIAWNDPVHSIFTFYKADVKPADALVFIGETLQVNCTLKPSTTNIQTSDMYFEIYSPTSKNTWEISKEHTTVVDNRTILAQIEITDQYPNYPTITCRTEAVTYLRSMAIYVQRPIRNITNFDGIFYFDNSTIVVTWSLGETYLDPSYIKVDVDWNPFSSPDLSGNNCSSLTQESCAIQYHGQDIIFFRVSVWYGLGERPGKQYLEPLYDEIATSVHRFLPNDNLKTGPPKFLKIVNKTSTCVHFSWEDPLYFVADIFSTTKYRLEIKMEDEAEFRVVVDSAVRLNSTEILQYCHLVPYTRYFLSVQVRAKDVNPWSDRAIEEFITEEDQPLTGPPLTDTSYLVEKCVKNKREFFLYWNDPQKASLQGQLTKYEVVRDNTTELLRRESNYYTSSIDCDSAYEIRVYSATKAGLSIKPSVMNIPKESDELSVKNDLMFRVEEITSDVRSSLNVSIKWDPADDHLDNVTLILYMCQEAYLPKTCFNDFTFREISVDKKEMELYGLPQSTNMFGYALKDGKGRKRGIQWTNCVYQSDRKPSVPLDLHVSPGSEANSLLISWTSTQCSKTEKVLILKYHLFICSQPVDNVTLMDKKCPDNSISNSSINNYTAKDLRGGHKYYVYIQAESPAGRGPISDFADGIPKASSTDTGEIVGAVFGAVFMMGLILFCLARCCFKAKRRLKGVIEIPKLPLSTVPPVTTRQYSDESGIFIESRQNSTIEGSCEPPAVPARLSEDVSDQEHAEADMAKGDLVQGPVSVPLASQEADQRTRNVSADTDNIHNFNMCFNDSESSAHYMQFADVRLASYRFPSADIQNGVSHEEPDSSGSVELDDSSVINLVSTEQSQPQINTNLPHLFLSPLSSSVQMVFNVEFNPNNTPVNNMPSEINRTQLSLQKRQSAARLQEFAAEKPSEMSTLEKQIDPKGEESSLSTDYVRCGLDGKIDSLPKYNSPEIGSVDSQEALPSLDVGGHQEVPTYSSPGTAATLSSTAENDRQGQSEAASLSYSFSDDQSDNQYFLTDHDYVKQGYLSSMPVTGSGYDPNMQVINQSLEENSHPKQAFANHLHSTGDDISLHSDRRGSIIDSDLCDLNMESLQNDSFIFGSSLEDDKSQFRRETEVQVIKEDSNMHMQAEYTNDNSSQLHTGNGETAEIMYNDEYQSSGAGYVPLDSMLRIKEYPCGTEAQINGCTGQAYHDLESDNLSLEQTDASVDSFGYKHISFLEMTTSSDNESSGVIQEAVGVDSYISDSSQEVSDTDSRLELIKE